MALKLRAKARPPQDSLHRRCALFDVRARACPALPQHVHCADRVGVLSVTTGDAVKLHLLRTVALVATTAARTLAGRVGGIDLFKDSSRLLQLPGDRLSKPIESRPQNGPVETGLLLDLRPGILDRTFRAFRHVLRLQVFRIHAAVLLRERMCGFPLEVLTNAAHPAMQPLNPLLQTPSLASRLVFVEGLGKSLLDKIVEDLGSTYNRARLLQDRKIFLHYRYPNGDGTYTEVIDTLSFRNRIRDGVNEWQDSDPTHYE